MMVYRLFKGATTLSAGVLGVYIGVYANQNYEIPNVIKTAKKWMKVAEDTKD